VEGVQLVIAICGAILMSMNQLKQLICLINQAFTPALLVGKLSYYQ